MSKRWPGAALRRAQHLFGRLPRRVPRQASAVQTAPVHPFDQQYGTDTSGFISGSDLITGNPHDQYSTAYYAMSPSRFKAAIDKWLSLGSSVADYNFVDLGCGKGRALLMASALPFRQAVGVELHPELVRIANANLEIWKACQRAMCCASTNLSDAVAYALPPGPCLLYLFHPFSEPLMKSLVRSLAEQFTHRDDPLEIIYFNPEAGQAFEHHPGFERIWTEVFPMSQQDAQADPYAGDDDLCSAYRWIGMVGRAGRVAHLGSEETPGIRTSPVSRR